MENLFNCLCEMEREQAQQIKTFKKWFWRTSAFWIILGSFYIVYLAFKH